MSKDFKDVLILLYDRFGDDLVDMGKAALVTKLQENRTQDRDSGVCETATSKHTHMKSAPIKESTASEEDVAGQAERSKCNSSDDEEEQVDYYNADVFEQKTLSEIQRSVAVIMRPEDVAGAVKDLILMAGEVRKFEEAQITVRTDIAARRDVALANIEVQKAALMTYLDKSFDERKENFQVLFSVVDDALEKNNMQQLAMSLGSIIKLAESSPFKDLKTVEATAAALTNPDHKWDF